MSFNQFSEVHNFVSRSSSNRSIEPLLNQSNKTSVRKYDAITSEDDYEDSNKLHLEFYPNMKVANEWSIAQSNCGRDKINRVNSLAFHEYYYGNLAIVSRQSLLISTHRAQKLKQRSHVSRNTIKVIACTILLHQCRNINSSRSQTENQSDESLLVE